MLFQWTAGGSLERPAKLISGGQATDLPPAYARSTQIRNIFVHQHVSLKATGDLTMRDPPKRPKNREVENEMVRPANRQGQPPRPATQPKARRPNPEEMRDD